jgi:outer membrane protein assembly factor BamA
VLIRLLYPVLLAACAQHHVGDPPTVKVVQFRESSDAIRWTRGTSDFHIRQAMIQKSSPFGAYALPWIPKAPLNRAQLDQDAWRVEVWYAHHGFFDARFQGWALTPTRWHADGTAKVLRITGHVREGRSSLIRQIQILGVEGMGVYTQRLLARASVAEGDRFSLEAHKRTQGTLQAFLQDQGFARAEVAGEVEVFPSEHAVDLRYRIQQVGKGYICRFGALVIEDFAGVPEHLVREAVAFEPGEVYSAKKLSETQVRLFSLGAFSVVRVSPELSGSGNVIPVRVTLAAAKPREFKLGAGLGVESGEQQIRASGGFRHANWLGRLWQIEGSVFAGYKQFGGIDAWDGSGVEGGGAEEWSDGGPFATSEWALTIPRPFGKGSQFRQGLEVERGLEEASQFFRWSAEPRFQFRFSTALSFSAGYRLEHWVGDLNEDLLSVEGVESLLEDYRISAFEQSVLFDLRDSKINTQQGFYLEAKLTEAGVGTGFRFWKAQTDMRRFWALRRSRGVLSMRLGGGLAAPHSWWGADPVQAYVPYAERFLLGGSSSVRGWESDHLGPLVCTDVDCVPRGAQAAVWGTIQLRLGGRFGFDPVVFLDSGMAWSDIASIDASELQPSAGLGARYGTPVGPLRVDVAWRLLEGNSTPGTARWALHAGLGEVF